MSTIKIIIEGEAADIFAQKLLEIPGISLGEDELKKVYKSEKVEKIIYLTAAIYTITQGVKSDIKDIVNIYNHFHDQHKLEVIIENPEERTFLEFNDWLDSCNLDSLDSLNQDLPSVSLPSLQEIAKLPIEERHQLLSPDMENMAEIFNNDPDLVNCWDIDGDE